MKIIILVLIFTSFICEAQEENFLESLLAKLEYNRSINKAYIEADLNSLSYNHNSIGFTLKEGDRKIYNGYRSEIALFENIPAETIATYKIEFELKSINDLNFKQKNSWVIIAQWHDQPNKNLGETWSDFPKRPPPVSLGLSKNEEQLNLILKTEKNRQSMRVDLDEKIKCNVSIEWLFIPEALIFGNCKTSNNEMEFKYYDRTMHNNYYHYFKFGLYIGPNVIGENKINFTNVSIYY